MPGCETIREHSVTLTKRLCGLLDLDLADSFISDLLLSEHFYVNHILLYNNPEKSKFLPEISCPDELFDLFEITITESIGNGSTYHKHREDYHGIEYNNVIYYRAKFSEPVGTFEINGVTLYQFEVVVIFEENQFINGFAYGKGFTHKDKSDPNCRSYPFPGTATTTPAATHKATSGPGPTHTGAATGQAPRHKASGTGTSSRRAATKRSSTS